MSLTAPTIDAQSVTGVLAEIAEIASETLELREVFDRVGAAVRQVIPFEKMGVVRILDGKHAVLHAATFKKEGVDGKCADGKDCSDPLELTAWSPRFRPRAGPNNRINDATEELDPAFPIDAMAMAGGM